MTFKTSTLAACVAISLVHGCARQAERPVPARGTSPPPGISQSPSPSVGPLTLTPVPPIAAFPLQKALDVTRHLSVDIGKRTAGSPGEATAASYIEEQFAAEGYEVSRQEVRRADGGASVNVIARPRGVDFSAGYILAGGHYDTIGESPGGNDNGTGIGVLVALGQIFSGRKVPIELVAFSAEERHPLTGAHHEGSRAYVAKLPNPSVIKAMISIDMVGNGPRVVIVRDKIRPEPLQSELVGVAAALKIPHLATSAGEISDHTSFTRKGIPGVLLWSGKQADFHTARDTFEIVQPSAVDRTGRLAAEWIKRRYQLP